MITDKEAIQLADSINRDWYLDDIDLVTFANLAIAKDREQLAKKIAQMPFGDTAASFALWIKEQP